MLHGITWRGAAQFVGTLTAVAFVAAACGGGGSGSDESYVKAMCEADNDLEPGVVAAFALEDPEEQAKAFADALEDWVKALRRAKPPSDVKTFHDDLLNVFDEGIDAVRRGDLEAGMGALLRAERAPEPSQETQARLEKVAAGVAECEGSDLFNGETAETPVSSVTTAETPVSSVTTAVVTNKTVDDVTVFFCVEYEEEDGTTGTLCKVGVGDFRTKCYDKVDVNDFLLLDCRRYGQLQTQ